MGVHTVTSADRPLLTPSTYAQLDRYLDNYPIHSSLPALLMTMLLPKLPVADMHTGQIRMSKGGTTAGLLVIRSTKLIPAAPASTKPMGTRTVPPKPSQFMVAPPTRFGMQDVAFKNNLSASHVCNPPNVSASGLFPGRPPFSM